jgi:hypothetical protein
MNIKKLIVGSSLFAANAFASAPIPTSLFLNCSATKTVAEQPCGGQNSKELKLLVGLNGEFDDSGYTLNQSYGGCFHTTSKTFGTISDAQVVGQNVTFKLSYGGYIVAGGVPVVDQNPQNAYSINASYNLDSKKLNIDMGNGLNAEPKLLACTGLH